MSRGAIRVALLALLLALALPYIASFESFFVMRGTHALFTAYFRTFGVPGGRTISPEQAALETMFSSSGKLLRYDTNENFLVDLRRASAPDSLLQSAPARIEGITMKEVRLPTGGLSAYWVIDDEVQKSQRMSKDDAPVLLYLHGGGFSALNVPYYRSVLAGLSRYSFIRVLAPEYRLIPENTIQDAVSDAVAWYKYLCERVRPETIFIAGDSAGAYLSLLLALHIRDHKLPRPAALLFLSPWLDIAVTGSTRNNRDPFLIPEVLARFASIAQPFQSTIADPFTASLRDFPPIYINGAGQDPCLDDARRFVAHAKMENVAVTYNEVESAFHDWFIFWHFIPEGLQEVQKISTFVKSHLHAYFVASMK